MQVSVIGEESCIVYDACILLGAGYSMSRAMMSVEEGWVGLGSVFATDFPAIALCR